MWSTVIKVTAITVPATIAVLDVFGYVARVEGASMQPALNPSTLKAHDYVFLNRWKVRNSYAFQRGEVVTATSPNNPSQKLIKRIIALEGDTIRTRNYKKRYVRIPTGHCWLEGDHTGQSMDSNLFGPVAVGLITAKATHIVWPPNRWQRIQTAPPANDRLVCIYSAENVAREQNLSSELDGLLFNSAPESGVADR